MFNCQTPKLGYSFYESTLIGFEQPTITPVAQIL